MEAERNAVLGPRQRRKVTYNEARLARTPDGAGLTPAKAGAGLTPIKEGADEDFRAGRHRHGRQQRQRHQRLRGRRGRRWPHRQARPPAGARA